MFYRPWYDNTWPNCSMHATSSDRDRKQQVQSLLIAQPESADRWRKSDSLNNLMPLRNRDISQKLFASSPFLFEFHKLNKTIRRISIQDNNQISSRPNPIQHIQTSKMIYTNYNLNLITRVKCPPSFVWKSMIPSATRASTFSGSNWSC